MSWKIGHPIRRDGTNQLQRLLEALRPENNPVDDRRVEDLLYFVYRLADQFAYYNENNDADGDWQVFFAALQDENKQITPASIRQYLTRAAQHPDNPVFMAILLAFLGMYEHLQQDINALTGQHLDFYFEQVLGFRRLPPTPDEAHVLLELSPQAAPHRLPAGTALKAGNDNLGRPLTYVTNRDIVVNRAKLAAIKTAMIADDGRVFAADTANSADGLGAPLDAERPYWPLFGDPVFMQPAGLGLALATPLLLLEEGQRLIELTVTFENIPEELTEADFRQFRAYGSGPDNWIPISPRSERTLSIDRENKQVVFHFALTPDQPPLTDYRGQVLNGNFDTAFPVLRLLAGDQPNQHRLLKDLVVTQAYLRVAVLDEPSQPGVQNLTLRNDQGPLNKNAAFLPFGAAPAKGARFYIGSREVFGKPLDQLIIQLRWSGLPDDDLGFKEYNTHYRVLPGGSIEKVSGKRNSQFTASFQVLADKIWSAPFDAGTRLFDPPGDSKLAPDRTIEINQGILQNVPLAALSPTEDVLPGTQAVQGFIRLSLEEDFGHQVYPKLIGDLSKISGATFPNQPYTPTLQSISIGYTASQTIVPGQQDSRGCLYHVQPFGSEAISPGVKAYLLPQAPTAALYLGFAGFEPPQNLHLLFQVAEGSAASTDVVRAEDIQWHYLTDGGWRAEALSDSEIVADTTVGLQKPGILVFQIGHDAGKQATQMPAGLFWLRASIQKDPAGAARALAIHPQVVTAVFQDNENDPAHLHKPLPANAITGLVDRDSAIRKVTQPYASQGGAPAEQNDAFYTRAGERLRHKQRAVTLWDIERLCLQQFPELYEAKAIPHTGLDAQGFYSEFQPGQVTVVLIPQLRNRNAVNPLQPRASAALLENARRYLQPLCTQFVGNIPNALQVINPLYEPILLSFSVGFHAGYDSGYYAGVLQDALRRRLSPWAYDESEDIRFGGRVYKSQLLAFVEEQEYVDYVTDFKMFHFRNGPGVGEMSVEIDLYVYHNSPEQDTDLAIATTAASILVSAGQHRIRALRPDEFPCENPLENCTGGIGCWYVDIDFTIS